jgi:superfamily II DNA or RNA helicase
MGERPSDLGDDDNGFALPPFEVVRHRARDSNIDREFQNLFGMVDLSATNLHEVKRQTIAARAEKVAEVIAAERNRPWIVWVNTDYEADAVHRLLPDAIEIRGSQSADEKEAKIEAFATGKARHIIGKPSMIGFGLDWSHCARMAFVGRSYSYETWYQAVRRCWRFGQAEKVIVHLIVAEGENEIGRVIDRKAGDHDGMKRAMREAMRRAVGQSAIVKTPYNPQHIARLPSWICAA